MAFALVALGFMVAACSTSPSTGTSTTGTGGHGGGIGGKDGGVCEPISYGEFCGACEACLEEHCCDIYTACVKDEVCLTCTLGYPLDPATVDCAKGSTAELLTNCAGFCPAPACHLGKLPPCFDGGGITTTGGGGAGGGGAGGSHM
ncbi:MAG: hypothetical protein ABI193_16440 [Minicystis sp.]